MALVTDMRLEWTGGSRFDATGEQGVKLQLDGDGESGQSPVQALLASFLGCMAIDVVTILKKMRIEPSHFSMIAKGDRNEDPPKFFRKIELVFRISDEAPLEKVERAIQLSFEKYCSVYHTLRSDLKVDHRIEIVSSGS